MSTRSTIRFRNDGDSPVCCVYKHFDGYIEGLGHDLAKWLKGMTLINGINNKEQYGHDYASYHSPNNKPPSPSLTTPP